MIVAKIENAEKKKEIMVNKNRLRGERVFIENDLELGGKKGSGKDIQIGKRKKKQRRGYKDRFG